MPIAVRSCRDVEEFQAALGAISEYLGGERSLERAERFPRNHPLEEMHAAFAGREIVGGAGSLPFGLTGPCGAVPCAGVTVVGVYPHRHRGVLTAMTRTRLEDVHERGEPVAALWASEERICGRLGNGIASHAGEPNLERSHADFAARSSAAASSGSSRPWRRSSASPQSGAGWRRPGCSRGRRRGASSERRATRRRAAARLRAEALRPRRVAGGTAQRVRTRPDVRLDVQALGSVYLGGFTFAELARAGRVEEAAKDGLARADALFAADRRPWCPEIF